MDALKRLLRDMDLIEARGSPVSISFHRSAIRNKYFRGIVECYEAHYGDLMNVLYPLPSLSSAESASDSAVTVLANHVIATNARSRFWTR
jgi:hypothetical protein